MIMIINQWELETGNRKPALENLSWEWLHLIGLDGGASFLDQSLREVKQNQSRPGSIENCSIVLY